MGHKKRTKNAVQEETNKTCRKPLVSLKFSIWSCLILAFIAAVCLFAPGFEDGNYTLWFADGNLGQHRTIVDAAKSLGGFIWHQTFFLGDGSPAGSLFYLNWPLLAVLPMGLSMWLNIFCHILLAAAGAWFCARAMGIGHSGAAFSGIAFGLTSHFVTLMGAGHLGKLQCIPWLPWTLGFFWKAWETGHLRYFLLTAVFYSPMWLSGEPQLPYYLGMYMALLSIYFTIQKSRERKPFYVKTLFKNFALSGLCLLIIIILSWQGIFTFMHRSVEAKPMDNTTSVEETTVQPTNDEKGYDFSTGWSFPPEETIIFLTSMRLFGTASPVYWGRMGTKSFHMTQVDHYMGVLVVIFALFALFNMRSNKPAWFLLFMLISSLFIAYGRYTPIYRLLYHLPTMSAQRIPSRWIALTALSFSMLAGIGYERFTQVLETNDKKKTKQNFIMPVLVAVMALATLVTWGILSNSTESVAESMFGAQGRFASSSTHMTQERTRLFISAFLHTGLLLTASAIILGLGLWLASIQTFSRTARPIILRAWIIACLAFTTLDLSMNDRNYIEFFNWKLFFRNDGLVDFFLRDPDYYRIQTIAPQQHPYLNQFTTYTAHWHKLRLANSPAASRLWPKYETLFKALSSKSIGYQFNPRYYDIFSVKYVLSPVELPPQIRDFAKLDLIRQLPMGNIAPLFLYKYQGFVSEPLFVPHTEICQSDDDVVHRLTAPDFDLNKTVVGMDLPDISADSSGSVILDDFGDNTIRISTQSQGPGWVVLKMKYDSNWKAHIDGEKAEIFNVNYVHCGIPVEPGQHVITMIYAPSRLAFNVTFTGWCFVAAGILFCLFWRLKEHLTRKRKNSLRTT